MEIIGLSGSDYIAKISHSELEKLNNKYYSRENIKKLQIGEKMDLGSGHDFTREIKNVCNEMLNVMQAFDRSKKLLTEFAIMATKMPKLKENEDE